MPDTDWQSDWLDDAPDPDEVNSRVLSLAARRVKLHGERRLRCDDHADAMRLLVAAETYGDLQNHICMNETPEAAEECFRVHKYFAQTVLSVRFDGAGGEAEAVERLTALAAECHLSRGRICARCRLPVVLHLMDVPEGMACPPGS